MPSPQAASRAPLLAGAAASARLAALGWVASSGDRIQLSLEWIEADTFSISRIRHTAASLHRAPGGDDSVMVLIGLEGHAQIRGHGRTHELTSRQMVIADTSTLVLETDAPSTRIQLILPRERLAAVQLFLDRGVHSVNLDERYRRVLASLIMSVLDVGTAAREPGFGHLASAIESAVAAAIVQSLSCTDRTYSRRASTRSHAFLRARAHRVIEERYHDAEFSIADLARNLAISPAHLHRVFRGSPTTPYQLLQQRRLKHARDLMIAPVASVAEVAERSGFRSLRALRRAMNTHLNEDGGRHD